MYTGIYKKFGCVFELCPKSTKNCSIEFAEKLNNLLFLLLD